MGLAAVICLVLELGACALVPRHPPEEALYPVPSSAKVDWYRSIARLPVLRHDRGGRWPLVLWEQPAPASLDRAQIRTLLARGIAPHLALSRPDIGAARAVEQAGAPVILMEGAAGAWPYDTVRGKSGWRLRFPPGARVEPWWRGLADPTRLAGWRRSEAMTRQRLQKYRAAGVKVDAVWLDYEGALLHDDYRALKASTAASRLPRGVLASERRYRDYRRSEWLKRLSRYLAAPVREVYPDASVTNWVVTVSSVADPVMSWTDWPHPPSPPVAFTDSNPIAYGIDTYFLSDWPPGEKINRENVDRFYTHLLLRQVSADAYNRRHRGGGMGAVAWVARWVPDHPGEHVPVMSRAAYREALRHIWLRGVDAMEVFNPARKGYERYAIEEVEDAQRVYDEMLAYRDFLERGKVMNYGVPDKRDASVLWSGLRLGDRALVRVTSLGAKQRRAYICLIRAWCVNLSVPHRGRTYILKAPASVAAGAWHLGTADP